MKKILFGISLILFSLPCFYIGGGDSNIITILGILSAIIGIIYSVIGMFIDEK